MLKAKLVVVGGDAKSKEVNLRLPTVIGRGRDVSLTLPHPLVSRRHTELFEKDGYLYVKDLGSLNGTYVNNRRINSEQRLGPNELLTLGNVTFRAMYDAGEAPNTGIVDQPELSDTDREHQRERDTKHPGSEKPQEKDETVQFERVDDAHDKDDLKQSKAKRSKARKPLKSVSTEQAAAPSNSASSDDASDKVETPSDIFSGDEDFLSPEKSISISALESLPPMNPSVSVKGSALNLGDQPQRSAIDSIDLDVEGQQRPADSDKSDAALGSFLKKLPR